MTDLPQLLLPSFDGTSSLVSCEKNKTLGTKCFVFMSMDPSDWEREHFYDEMYAQASQEAVESFTADRLRSYYDREPVLAEDPFVSLAEAKGLIQTPHSSAAFLHATIAIEVILKGVIVKPIVSGFVHTDSMAVLIVELALASRGFNAIKPLLAKIFEETCSVNLLVIKRLGSAQFLWDGIVEIQKKRNLIMHRAQRVSADEVKTAIGVAEFVTIDLFPRLVCSLGFHLHEEFRLCRQGICSLPPELRKLIN